MPTGAKTLTENADVSTWLSISTPVCSGTKCARAHVYPLARVRTCSANAMRELRKSPHTNSNGR